jgi:hypothetical protein
MRSMVRINQVTPLDGFVVRLSFTDGTQRDVDLEPFLHGPIFDPMQRDRDEFLKVSVDSRAGTIVWPNGADIDPDVLYLGLQPAWRDASRMARPATA